MATRSWKLSSPFVVPIRENNVSKIHWLKDRKLLDFDRDIVPFVAFFSISEIWFAIGYKRLKYMALREEGGQKHRFAVLPNGIFVFF